MSPHGRFDDDADEGLLAEINMTPLVDVMLVLLIVFIITVPVIHHAARLDLPTASSQPEDTRPPRITLSMQADGHVAWNGESLTRDGLESRLTDAARAQPQPELHLQVDRGTPYEHVAHLLADASRLGLARVAFVTEPGRR